MKTERVIHEVLDNILGSIVVFGDDGKITFINRVGIEELGYHSVDTDITSILSMLFHNHMNISDYIKTIDGTQIRTSVYRKNNTCFPTLIEIKRVLSSTGENLNVLSIRNETDETIMEKELDQAKQDMEETMRVRNELVANITQINQAMSQVSQVVQTNSATSEQCASASEELSNQAEALRTLISKYRLKDNHVGYRQNY